MTLTKTDLRQIRNLVKVTVGDELDEAAENKLATKEDIKFLPTKDEFYIKMDKMMGELKTIREEQTLLSGLNVKVNNYDTRIEVVERKLQIKPAFA